MQDVKLTIRGVSDSGQTIEINQATTVQTDQTQIVIMRIGELGSGSYTLTAKGNSPIGFDQTTQLTYVHKSYSVFIQTDKAIYRDVQADNVLPFNVVHSYVQSWAKEPGRSCVNSPPAARGNNESGFTQPRAHSFP